MNPTPPLELDAFETSLLTELRSHVARTAATNPMASSAAEGPRRRTLRRRWFVGIAAAVSTVVVAAVLLVHGLWPTPAYAVTGRSSGEVTVRVMRLEGAGQLERALEERGVPADITYLPTGKRCAPGRYTPVPASGLVIGISATEFFITIPPGTVGKDDTFVMSAAVVPIANGFTVSVDFDIAHGPVRPCRIIDAP